MGNSVNMGYNNSLYVNTGTYAEPNWEELDLARDVTSNDNVGQVDVTSRRTARVGMMADGYGLRKIGWKADMLVPAAGETNEAYSAIESARIGRLPVDILHVEGGVLTTDGLPATRAVCGVFGGEKGEPLNGASTRKYDLSFIQNSDQDVPLFGTTDDGDFVPAS